MDKYIYTSVYIMFYLAVPAIDHRVNFGDPCLQYREGGYGGGAMHADQELGTQYTPEFARVQAKVGPCAFTRSGPNSKFGGLTVTGSGPTSWPRTFMGFRSMQNFLSIWSRPSVSSLKSRQSDGSSLSPVACRVGQLAALHGQATDSALASGLPLFLAGNDRT